MHKIDIEALKALADAAIKPWGSSEILLAGNPRNEAPLGGFIAACSPSAIIALIARLERAEAVADAFADDDKPPISASTEVHISWNRAHRIKVDEQQSALAAYRAAKIEGEAK